MAKTAAQWKEEGNNLYKEGRLEPALVCYDKAVEIDPNTPVYRSNRSACLLELGRYAECMTEVREALSQLGKEGDAALKLKLWRRLIVVMAYTRDTAMEEQLADTIAKARADVGSALDEPRITLLEQQLLSASPAPSLPPISTLPRLRPSMLTTVREYYPLGHDPAESALGSRDPRKSRETEGQTCLHDIFAKGHVSLVFGGCGDGRFFLATLIDLWQRLDERYVLGEDDTLVGMAFAARHKAPLDIKPLDVKVVLNDIKGEALAKLVLILVLLQDLATLFPDKTPLASVLPNGDDAEHNVAKQVAFLTRVYLGLFLPPAEEERLFSLMQELLATEDISTRLPFLHCTRWPEVRDAYGRWLRLRGHVDASDLMQLYEAGNSDAQMDAMRAQVMSAGGEMGMMEEVYRRMDSERQQRIAVVDAMSEAELKACRPWPPNTTLSTMRKEWRNFVGSLSTTDVGLMRDLSGGLGVLTVHRNTGLTLLEHEMSNFDPLTPKTFLDWRVNVTLLAEDWVNATTRLPTISHALGNLSLLAQCTVGCGDQTVLQLATRFFGGAARAIHHLTGKTRKLGSLAIDVVFGDVHGIFDPTAESPIGDSPEKAERLDRIVLSNVPDYTTLLPTFLTLLPRLRPHVPKAKGVKGGKEVSSSSSPGPATLFHNLALAVNQYEDGAAYGCRSLSLPSNRIEDAEILLGARLFGGDIWREGLHWQALPAPLPPSSRAFASKLESYLRGVLISIALPPWRDAREGSTHHYPCTLRMFFDLMHHLHAHLGYPPHTLAAIFENILHKPSQVHPTDTRVIVSTSLCDCEMRALASAYVGRFADFPRLLTPRLTDVGSVCTYVIDMSPVINDNGKPGILDKYTMGMNMGEGVGQPGSPALSALLIRKSDLFEEGGEEDGDPFLSQYVEHMPTGEEVPRPRRNMHAAGTAGALKLLREVGCKPENAQILTAITWDSRKEALTFVLGERDMGRMREEGGWGVVLWRIDSYQVLSWPTPLEKATKVVW